MQENNIKGVLSHARGNPFATHAALAIYKHHYQLEVVTTIAYDAKKQKFIKSFRKIHDELSRRDWKLPQSIKFHSYPKYEILRIILEKQKIKHDKQKLLGKIDISLENRLIKKHLRGVHFFYGYEDMCADSLEFCKRNGIVGLYDLPIAFYKTARKIQQEEADLFPELSSSLQAVNEPAWKIERKEKEIALADKIFVPSSFVKTSLVEHGVNVERIAVNPFGAPVNCFSPARNQKKAKFTVLFVGRVGPRKGVHYLIKAWRELKLPKAELLLIGIDEFPEGWLSKEISNANIIYIKSIPHSKLLEYYQKADVFLFPSLVEGLALVQLEALACGLPVISTKNAGAEDIITEAMDGFIIESRNPEQIKEKVIWCYENPSALAEMSKNARKKAERLTWEKYEERLIEQLKSILN